MKKAIMIFTLCLCVGPLAMGQNLLIVTEQRQLEIEGAGNIGDYLRGLGYTVTVDAGEDKGTSVYEGVLEDDEIAYLESFDAVIVHRSVSSGDYDDFIEQWNDLDVPMLNGSAYLVRNTRWFWIDSAQQRTSLWESVDIVLPDHPIVAGLTGEFFDVPLGIDHVGPGDVGGGTIVATILNDSGEDAPAIVAWEPGQEFAAAGGQIAANARVFLPLYRYHETVDNEAGSYATDPADGEFANYTDNGLQLINQAVQYLLSFSGGTGVQSWELY